MDKPRNIDECMVALGEVLSPEDKVEFIKMAKDDLIMLHHGLGQWIRNNWGLWEQEASEGTLLKHMKDLGFYHPDDMSQSIIVEYWNRLHEQPSDLKTNIQESKDYWSKNGSQDPA